jgi:predicted alternative tryptophan synthase beta-subunit
MKRKVIKLRRAFYSLSPIYRHHRRRQLLRRKPHTAGAMEMEISEGVRHTFTQTDATGMKVGI